MDFFATLLLSVIALVIGVLLGLLLSGLRSSKNDEEDVAQGDLEAVAGLWRDPETGRPVVEAGGKVFRTPEEMNEGERQLLEAAADELRRWSGSNETAEIVQKSSTVSGPAGPEATGELRQAGESGRGSLQPTPVGSLNPFKIFGDALKPAREAAADPGAQSIVLQIDEILQDRLKNSSLDGRGIQLLDLPGQGMAVKVGLENYGSVEDVPDPEIREAIQQAVSEWESRMKGK